MYKFIYNNINRFWRVLLGELTAKMRFSIVCSFSGISRIFSHRWSTWAGAGSSSTSPPPSSSPGSSSRWSGTSSCSYTATSSQKRTGSSGNISMEKEDHTLFCFRLNWVQLLYLSSTVWGVAECGWDLAQCGWDLAEFGWDLADFVWDLAECGVDEI